jgi:outer membrane protein assembly factor BamB
MSPEQVQGHPAGPQSDVFSLGSVLTFAASGASPFSVGPEAMPAAVLYRVVHGAPQLDTVPPEARDLIQACLAKDPSWRPDLGQVAARCAAAAESLGMTPASFWPAEVAAAIEAQRAATSTEISALASLETAVPAGPLAFPAPAPETWPGAVRPQPDTHKSPRITRRMALIGAGIGGAGALIGAGAWLAGSRSRGNASGPIGFEVPMSGTAAATTGGTGAGVSAVWTFPTDNLVLASPGAANGTVYVGDEDKFLYAVDAATGKQRWKADIGWVTAPPQVVDGMVCAATSEGVFSAIHASTGAVAWQRQTETAAAFRPNWAVNGKTVLLPSATDPLTVYDAATGAKGPVTFGSPGQFSPGAISAANGILYAIEPNGDLFAVEIATAGKKWDAGLSPADGASFADLVVSDGALYITDDNGVLYSLSTANGKQNWSYPAGGSHLTHPVVGDGLVYVADDGGTLHAVSTADGKQAWTGKAMSGGEIGPTVSGGTLYVASGLALQALNAQTGDAIWSFTAPVAGAFTSTPAISGGLVFAGSTNKNLYAVRA